MTPEPCPSLSLDDDTRCRVHDPNERVRAVDVRRDVHGDEPAVWRPCGVHDQFVSRHARHGSVVPTVDTFDQDRVVGLGKDFGAVGADQDWLGTLVPEQIHDESIIVPALQEDTIGPGRCTALRKRAHDARVRMPRR